MSLFHTNTLIGASGSGADSYTIERSLRFNSGDSSYLSRSPSSAGNRQTFTLSWWMKRCDIASTNRRIFGKATGTNQFSIMHEGNGRFYCFFDLDSPTDTSELTYNVALKDPSAWYHCVMAFDTTQSTDSDRIKFWLNGVFQNDTSEGGGGMALSNWPSQNASFKWNENLGGLNYFIGGISGFYTNTYLTEIYNIDGQALQASDFGEYDSRNVWVPKEYEGTFGTNGFYLNFSDDTSTSTIAADQSGQGNDWTANNISVSGTGTDSMLDSPTNGTQTDTGVGGEVVGNYATLNPLNKGSTVTLSNGNLDFASGATYNSAFSTIGVTSGKWYMEATAGTFANDFAIGISNDVAGSTYVGGTSGSYGYEAALGAKYNNTSYITTGYSTYTTNDVISVAFDADNGKVFFAKNGVWQESGNPATGANPAYSGLTDGPYFFGCSTGNGGTFTGANFGQRPFAYTAPSGFKALCTTNLPDPTIADGSTAFDAVTYTGNGSTQTISGLDFSPDLVWIKNRSATDNHKLTDTVRGATKELESNTTDAEVTNADGLTAFNSDGFDLGADLEYNTNTESYVAWAWDGGSSTASNTDGSITSSVRANTSTGFSIVSYTGTGSAATVGHGLNATPEFLIVKRTDNTNNWYVQHASQNPGTDSLFLDATTAATARSADWNSTAAASSVFSVGTISSTNGSGATYIAYCFAPVAGYSAFGKYTGNGDADGPFIYTGFRPRWIMVKTVDILNSWYMLDTKRSTDNSAKESLVANLDFAEGSGTDWLDILSNGFKIRTTNAGVNSNTRDYIYAAFAEHPFKTARAR